MIKSFLNYFVLFFQYIFVRKEFFLIHKVVYLLSIRGLGLFNYQNAYLSGENWFLSKISPFYRDKNAVIFDVGANKGEYLQLAIKKLPFKKAVFFAFEPNIACFKYLKESKLPKNVILVQNGLGKEKERVFFYDDANDNASGHASLYKEVLSDIQNKKIVRSTVPIITLDQFCKENHIENISVLKIDTEGNEYPILLGAKDMLKKNKIDFIQFEFNSMNVISRVYFRDFLKLLGNYIFYRLLPNGLINMQPYDPIICELFGFQNIIAVNKLISFL